jgi:zinc/manganese transport system substrate-binding protein
MPTLPRLAAATLLTLALGGTLSACDSTSASPVATTGQRRFQLVAAENFWGSIAAQLAGDRASLRSIIVNPETDPHSYQPSAQDARTVAAANMVIVNGIGYDNWMTQLLAADQAGAHTVLNVGDVLGLGEGQNPHQWYSPASVNTVVRQIVADYDRIDPSDSAYFAERERTFETNDLARYDALREEIRSRYAGVPVGYSESIFQPLGEALGLRLLTPYSFAKSIAEGTDVTAQDKETVDGQAEKREIKVWIYNSQNVTPDVQRVTALVRAQHIPVVSVTETLSPATDSFEQWQVSELEELKAALHRATGR